MCMQRDSVLQVRKCGRKVSQVKSRWKKDERGVEGEKWLGGGIMYYCVMMMLGIIFVRLTGLAGKLGKQMICTRVAPGALLRAASQRT